MSAQIFDFWSYYDTREMERREAKGIPTEPVQVVALPVIWKNPPLKIDLRGSRRGAKGPRSIDQGKLVENRNLPVPVKPVDYWPRVP